MFDDIVVRVRPDAWRHAAERRQGRARAATTSRFIVGHRLGAGAQGEGDEGSSDTSSPVQPTEMTFGAAGSAGRFQVFAHVQSTRRHWGVHAQGRRRRSRPARRVVGVRCTRAPTGTSASAGRCTASCSTGTRASGTSTCRCAFEGHPLRKDFPLLARVVKPWPGLVDVEPMPGEPASEGAAPRATRHGGSRGRIVSTTDTPTPDIQLDPGALRHLADAQVNVELDTGDMILNLGPAAPRDARHAATGRAARRRARRSPPIR